MRFVRHVTHVADDKDPILSMGRTVFFLRIHGWLNFMGFHVSNEKTLVVCGILGIILANYIVIMFKRNCKDPYQPTSIMESRLLLFFFVAHVGKCSPVLWIRMFIGFLKPLLSVSINFFVHVCPTCES